MSYTFYLPAKASGAPVTFSLLKADNYDVTSTTGIIKGAPDPLAAELTRLDVHPGRRRPSPPRARTRR